MDRFERVVRGYLEEADVHIDDNRPQDIHVQNPDFYKRVLAEGSLGLGESYMDEWWDANALDAFFEQVLRANLHEHVQWNRHNILAILLATVSNRQTRERSKQVARRHYDLSGVLPEALLDPYNQYTCAYFDETCQLDSAQEKKLDLLCRKLQLQESDRVLDIGCGWGGFAKYAAEHVGCQVTGITISEEQARYASSFCEGLSVAIHLCDYRDLEGEFDKVLTCGMVEHVGYKNYSRLFHQIHDHLSDDGLYLLHTIGTNRTNKTGDPFLVKYIFPNGMAPSFRQIDSARQGLFSLRDVHCLTSHYSPTLLSWNKNFQSNWDGIAAQYDERFRRMFEYYLLMCAGAFRADQLQLWQMVFSKEGHVVDYTGVR